MTQKNQHGFTLLEMLVALALLAVLSLTAWQVLQNVVRSSETARQHAESLSQLQFTFDWLQRDLTHAQIRPVQQLVALVRPDFIAGAGVLGSEDEGIEVVHNEWANPGGVQPRSRFERVGYRLYQRQLQRLSYPFPDMPAGSEPHITTLLDNVSEFRLRYYNGTEWLSRWQASTLLPQAIEVTLALKGRGIVHRVWLLNNYGAG